MPRRPAHNESSDTELGATAMQIGAGRRLAAVRQMVGLTQVKLGELLQVDQSAVGKWETGSRMPDPYKMSAVCARFGVTMDFVYRGRLEGVNRELALALAQAHPDLVVVPPPRMGSDRGMDQP